MRGSWFSEFFVVAGGVANGSNPHFGELIPI